MADDFPDDLLRAIRNPRGVLVVVGTGVTIGATAGTAGAASWRGLLEEGINRCAQRAGVPLDWASRQRENLARADLDELVALAGLVEAKLGGPSGGEYRRWLRDCFEGLVAVDRSVLEALRDLEADMATTNIDGLLESNTGRGALTWRDPDALRVVRGDDDRILHFHGYWEDPESVILGQQSYQRLKNDARARAIREALGMTRTLLYVGCGDGLKDPSFGSFLRWSREVFAESVYRHFRLCRESERVSVEREHSPDERIVALSYGSEYRDLGPFLRRLKEASERIPFSWRAGRLPHGAVRAAEEALRAYRRQARGQFSRWDLGASLLPAAGIRRSRGAELDDIYMPLRLAAGLQPPASVAASPLSPAELLERKRPLVIRGPAGTGKTTWMKWTFRRLLEIDDAVPVLLLLRDLGERWSKLPKADPARSLDAFVRGIFEEWLGTGNDLWPALTAGWGPTPVLLVDGWDEIGALGEELREKLLGLLAQYPRLRTVVTSRPYGVGAPTHSEGFEVLDIQPLSHDEIETLAQRFFGNYLGYDGEAARASARALSDALRDLPAAAELARNPLLLTMLLTISGSRPLPAKRHLLFEECLDTLLFAAHRRSLQGAASQPDEWHPEDSEEILRVIAKLAYDAAWDLHQNGTGPLRSWDETMESLPTAWRLLQRRGFIKWLCDSVGLLIDSADGKLSFAHNSVREYLTAWHLNAMGADANWRREFFIWGGTNARGWESLVLWAAMISGVNPDALVPILDDLSAGPRSCVLLAGMIFAENLGAPAQFARWLERAREVRIWENRPRGQVDSLTAAWRRNGQEDRRSEIGRMLGAQAMPSDWLEWARLNQFSRVGGFAPVPPPSRRLAALFSRSLEPEPTLVRSGALDRLLAGVLPALPLDAVTSGLLHCWPSRRRLTGFRLQLAALCGFDREMLRVLAGRLLLERAASPSEIDRELRLRSWMPLRSPGEAGDFYRDWVVREFPGSWGTQRSIDLSAYWIHEFWFHCWQFNAEDEGSVLRAVSQSRWSWSGSRDYPTAETLAEALQVPGSPIAVRDFVLLDIATPGRSVARAFLAHRMRSSPREATAVISAACWESLHPTDAAGCLDAALLAHGRELHPLWLALSRHLVRLSNTTDRTMLSAAADNPESQGPELATALRYIVRGDVLLEDGSEVTLDQLSDEAGLPHLPYLEDMPEDLQAEKPPEDPAR